MRRNNNNNKKKKLHIHQFIGCICSIWHYFKNTTMVINKIFIGDDIIKFDVIIIFLLLFFFITDKHPSLRDYQWNIYV